MPAFIVGPERNLTALTKAVVSDRVTPALSRRFADAVRAANPGIEFDRLQPGDVIEVPDVPGVPTKTPSPTSEPGRFGATGVFAEVGAQLEALVAASARASDESEREREQTLAVLTSGELKEAGRAERSGPTIAASTAALAADRDAAAERRKSLEAAHGEWTTELAGLAEMIGQ